MIHKLHPIKKPKYQYSLWSKNKSVCLLNLFNSILLFYQNHNYEWYKSYKLHELFTYSVYTNSLEEHI